MKYSLYKSLCQEVDLKLCKNNLNLTSISNAGVNVLGSIQLGLILLNKVFPVIFSIVGNEAGFPHNMLLGSNILSKLPFH